MLRTLGDRASRANASGVRASRRVRVMVRPTWVPLIILVAACSGLLDVSNPTIVRDSDVANANGANARRLNVVSILNRAAPDLMQDVARITDEWIEDDPVMFGRKDYLDRRDSQGYEQFMAANDQDQHLGGWDQIYWQTSLTIPSVRAYTPDSLKGDYLGQLYAIRGYAALQIAEDICPGFPLNDVTADNQPLFGPPLTTDSAMTIASTQLDSAVKYAHDSVRFVTLAKVVKGRVLLDQGKYAEAAAMVASVGTADTYQTDGPYNSMGDNMAPGTWNQGGYNYAAGDSEGTNGLPFVSAHDPRVPTVLGGTRATIPTDTLYKPSQYTSSSPMVLASGIEARLIEAEAALHVEDPSWLTILNTLRESSGMSDLFDPGTTPARIDLLYHERAFWLYGTGRRLGDLRRLIRNYGRDPETVFPTGPFILGGTYGTATAIPFILKNQQHSNPRITSGCTTR